MRKAKFHSLVKKRLPKSISKLEDKKKNNNNHKKSNNNKNDRRKTIKNNEDEEKQEEEKFQCLDAIIMNVFFWVSE